MNLIEQLGGYEKAKEKLKMFYILRTETMVDAVGNIFDRSQLEAALLQYRRQHNIFGVGDKVVYVDDFMPDSVSVVSEVNDRVWLNNNNAVCIKEMIKHAEGEEIKAGKRLGVKSEN
ncbi:hypothetical protein ABEF81_08850 [Acinetobacter thermotolerans]|uniref:hypothetical protein n=1 Tax=Acinetobacter thermotolerans TaxID=3151487 RepID=UPI00325B5633